MTIGSDVVVQGGTSLRTVASSPSPVPVPPRRAMALPPISGAAEAKTSQVLDVAGEVIAAKTLSHPVAPNEGVDVRIRPRANTGVAHRRQTCSQSGGAGSDASKDPVDVL